MPWAETSPMDQKLQFIAAYQAGTFSVAELCERYGISRKTGYKWIGRYRDEGVDGLKDRSRAPHRSPHKMSDAAAEAIIHARRLHPTWGPRKLIAVLRDRMPELELPSPTAAGNLLAREGLVQTRGRRRRRVLGVGAAGGRVMEPRAPNDVWTADYKGEFRTRDRNYCYPLTIADQWSRFIVGIQAMQGTDGYGARSVFERAFREYGLPRVMHTDNGSPFASRGLLGLTQLSVWWIELGIQPLRSRPSHPEDNGAHERMHRTLKAETARPPAGNQGAQQRRFNRFRREFNEERPHEALGQKPPASCWTSSSRRYPEREPLPEYPEHFEVRWVSDAGAFVFYGKPVFLGTALAQKRVGFEEVDDGIWSVYFFNTLLGRYDKRKQKFQA